MKSIRVGEVVLVACILAACSSGEHANGDERSGSIGVDLRTADGVVIESVAYDLDTQTGAQVAEGSIPVPEDDSVISLGIESLAPGGYRLAFSAQATYLGTSIPCVSAPLAFSLTESQHLTLPTVSLICSVEVTTADDSGGVTVGVEVVVETITVGNAQEVLSYGPRSVRGRTSGGSCVYPPIALAIENRDPAISYTWSASPDGSFALNATNTNGTYTCQTSGEKALTLAATRGSVSGSKTITVTCHPCTGDDTCGDGAVTGPEQCDEQTPRCTDCVITPVCGDAVIDVPELCDPGLPNPPCDANCGLVDPLAACFSCMDANSVIAPIQAASCDPESRCTAVQRCVLESGCFLAGPGACYCGPNLADCRSASFVPAGPCHEEIAAGVNVPQPTNTEVLDRIFRFEHPTGVAMLILDEALRACRDQCFGSTPGCGNGGVDPGEQCDEDSARCVNCRIVPVCGDGIVDAGEQCDPESEHCVDCQLIPGCGNAVLEPGEECDAGEPSERCDAQCRLTDTTVPSCLLQCSPGELGPVQATYCDPHAACRAVEACVFETGCFLPIAATCYCGSNIVDCRGPAFVPQGPCKDVIRAGSGFDNPSNATIVDRLFDFNYPTGVGMLIVDEVSRQCPVCAL